MLLFLKNNDFTCSLHIINYTKILFEGGGGEASVPSLHSHSQASAVRLGARVGGTQTKPK